MFKYNEIDNTIETERLLLRRFVQSDSEKVAEICNTDEVWKGTLALPHPYTTEMASNWISKHDDNFNNNYFYDYAVTDKNNNNLYGCMGIGINQSQNMGKIGYWIDPKMWNNGIATEAAQAIIQFAFEIKNIRKVNARYFSYNKASGRVMEKAGMKKEGLQEKHIQKNGKYVDLVLYGLINPNM